MVTDTTAVSADQSRGWRFYLQKNVVVLFLLGFSAGLPFLLVYSTLSAWLKDAGLQMSTISTFAWLGFAYSLKFVWAPFIDSLPLPGLTPARRSACSRSLPSSSPSRRQPRTS